MPQLEKRYLHSNLSDRESFYPPLYRFDVRCNKVRSEWSVAAVTGQSSTGILISKGAAKNNRKHVDLGMDGVHEVEEPMANEEGLADVRGKEMYM